MSGMADAHLGVIKKEKKMIAKEEMNKYRTTTRVVGIVYILGFVVGLAGIGLFTSILGAPDHLSTVSANSMLLGYALVSERREKAAALSPVPSARPEASQSA